MRTMLVLLVIAGAALAAAAKPAFATDIDHCGSVGECASDAPCRTERMGHICGTNKACVFHDASCDPDTVLCFCLTGGVLFEEFSQPLIIEDDNPADLSVAVVAPPTAGIVLDMMIQLTIQHPAISDLVVTLSHSGTTVTLMNRPGFATGGPACGAELSCERSIYLSDGGSAPIDCGSAGCTACFPNGQVPVGVYVPTMALDAFANQSAGGPWVLSIADHAAGNVGALCRWGMSMVFQQPVGVRETPWGAVKALYRD